jgi:hypothetical protein
MAAGQVAAALNRLWALLTGTVLWVPDVTGLPQVQRLTGTSTAVVNTGFVLAVIGAGVMVMTRETLQVRYGIGELAPRLVVAFVAANLSGPITRALIGAANALTVGLTGEGIAQSGAFGQLARTVTAALTNPAAALLVAVLGLIIAVLVGMLIVLHHRGRDLRPGQPDLADRGQPQLRPLLQPVPRGAACRRSGAGGRRGQLLRLRRPGRRDLGSGRRVLDADPADVQRPAEPGRGAAGRRIPPSCTHPDLDPAADRQPAGRVVC